MRRTQAQLVIASAAIGGLHLIRVVGVGVALDDQAGHSLFRAEALDAYSSRFGSPVRPITLRSWLITAFLAGLLLVVGVFLSTTKFARKETVVGVLEPTAGAGKLVALRPGIVSGVHAGEGDLVRKGQPLLTISLDTHVDGGVSLNRLLEDAAADQGEALERETQAKRDDLRQRWADIATRREGLQALLSAIETRQRQQERIVSRRRETVAGYNELLEKKIVSPMLFRQQEEGLLDAESELTALTGDQKRLASQLTLLDVEERRLTAERALLDAHMASGKSQLREKEATIAAQGQLVLPAETDGRLTALRAKPGAAVTAGQTLAVVLPAGAALQAELWAPSRAAGFVRVGDRVRLMYDAFPYQQFGVGGGTVTDVALAPTPPQDLPFAPTVNEALYRVMVRLDRQTVPAYGKAWGLAPGMRLTADMVLEKRSIFAWALEPLLAVRQRGDAGGR